MIAAGRFSYILGQSSKYPTDMASPSAMGMRELDKVPACLDMFLQSFISFQRTFTHWLSDMTITVLVIWVWHEELHLLLDRKYKAQLVFKLMKNCQFAPMC